MAATSSRKPLASRLADARKDVPQLTQERLAIRLGCSVVTVAKCEQGSRSPSKPLLRRWAKITGQPVSWFYGENGKKPA